MLYNEINSKSDKTATVDEMKFIINKAVYIEAIRGGKVDNLYDYSKQLNIENTRINQFTNWTYCNIIYKIPNVRRFSRCIKTTTI